MNRTENDVEHVLDTGPGQRPRTVAVVTGTRAEYGLLRSSMEAIRRRDDLELVVVATGMHLSPRHGYTVDEIEADGFTVDRRLHTQLDGDSGLTMAKSLGIAIAGFAEVFGDLGPDVVLVAGDRDEAFAAAVAAAHMNVPVAHLHGGDSMHGAVIDDSIRHALSKFAHVHFPVSELSKGRLLKLGEEEWRITVVGAPGLDAITGGEYAPADDVLERYGFDSDEPLALVVQHPVTSDADAAGDQMRATLDALVATGVQVVLVYPNSDPGSARMVEVVEGYDLPDRFRIFRNLPREDYLGFMSAADVMVGNSSSGIIEAPSFGLPVVDVGPRQEGRERGENTISVPHDATAIRETIERCLTDESFRARVRATSNPYDRGGAGERIAARLATLDFDDRLLRKRLTY